MNDDTQLFTLQDIYKAWYDYYKKQHIRPSYINSTFDNFKQHLTQNQ